MSLLTIVQDVCRRVGLVVPTSVVGNTDQTTIRLLGLANEDGEELCDRFTSAHAWSALRKTATFLTSGVSDQGLLTTLMGSDYASIVRRTMWNETLQRKYGAAVSAEMWRDQVVLNSSLQWDTAGMTRIYGNRLYIWPVPTAGQTVSCEYRSKNWVSDAAGTNTYSVWNADTDTTFAWPERVAKMGLVWRWKQSIGLEYAEDFRKYEAAVTAASLTDGDPQTLTMDGGNDSPFAFGAAIPIVPGGSWGV